MDKQEVVYGLFVKDGIFDKEFLHEKGVFKNEEDARKEWEFALNNGCWLEEIILR